MFEVLLVTIYKLYVTFVCTQDKTQRFPLIKHHRPRQLSTYVKEIALMCVIIFQTFDFNRDVLFRSTCARLQILDTILSYLHDMCYTLNIRA